MNKDVAGNNNAMHERPAECVLHKFSPHTRHSASRSVLSDEKNLLLVRVRGLRTSFRNISKRKENAEDSKTHL